LCVGTVCIGEFGALFISDTRNVLSEPERRGASSMNALVGRSRGAQQGIIRHVDSFQNRGLEPLKNQGKEMLIQEKIIEWIQNNKQVIGMSGCDQKHQIKILSLSQEIPNIDEIITNKVRVIIVFHENIMAHKQWIKKVLEKEKTIFLICGKEIFSNNSFAVHDLFGDGVKLLKKSKWY
jgi:hypothetical protein